MHFCVFSYNRGRFLRHCVDSIMRCVDAPRITVFDDDSDEPETLQVLEALEADAEVVRSSGASLTTVKCGGLYGNMQRALEHLSAGSLACCIQDDMQLVRRLDNTDLAAIDAYFAHDARAVFLQPTFMRASRRALDRRITRYDAAAQAYFREPGGTSVGVYFSAVSIFHVDRLRAAGWVFEPTEKRNEQQARPRFAPMGFMRDPFMFYLPNVPAYRGKIKTWALRHAERLNRCGFYPFRLLDGAGVAALRARDPGDFPVAEDWLQVDGTDPGRPWRFYPMEGAALLKRLNSLELRLRRLWRLVTGGRTPDAA